MKTKLLSVAVALVALAAAPAPAFADSGGPGGLQAGLQSASTTQAALGVAASHQNAVNANVPVSIAGGNITGGTSSATQTASSNATTDVANKSETEQKQKLDQDLGGSSCKAGCGGAGGFQVGVQKAETNQAAIGVAKSDQNAVNANVPVSIAGGNITGGTSSATQNANSNATANVKNKSETEQKQKLDQDLGSSSCHAGCGGAGGFQVGVQKAETNQAAIGVAKSDQNAVNANVPVSIAGGDIASGSSSATQNANSNATANVKNKSETEQSQKLDQDFGCGCDHKDGKGDHRDGEDSRDSKDGCVAGCGGAGGFQLGIQKAETEQAAIGIAKSDQNAVNGNAPVSIAGGDITSGSSSATQNANSNATTNVKNKSETEQNQRLSQDFGSSSCHAGCGGAGGFQVGIQKAETSQLALGLAKSDQNAVNGNAPVSTAGGNITSGPSSATQTASSNATANVKNKSETEHKQKLDQDFGCGCDHKDGKDKRDSKDGKGDHNDSSAGSGGAGGFQLGIQKAETKQLAAGIALSKQNAVNGNAPVSTAGGNITSGPSSATQTASSNATANVKNKSETEQKQKLDQDFGCGCDHKGRKDGKDRKGDHNDSSAGSGGAGGFQLGIQKAETKQLAAGIALSKQNAVNSNAPHAVAGYDIWSGSSNATQTATSNGTANVKNKSETEQKQKLDQDFGKGCGCDRKHDGKGSRPRGGNTPADDSREAWSPVPGAESQDRTSPSKVQRQED
jgi:hypothetical protein